jgi:hypothetical protein
MLRWGVVAAAITRVILAAGVLALAAVLVTTLAIQIAPDQAALIVLGSAVAVVLLAGGWTASRRPLYRASLIGTAVWMPGIVAILTVLLFLVLGADGPADLARDGLLAVLFGTGLGVSAWFIVATANQSFSRSNFANSRSYSQLTTRRQLLGSAENEYTRRIDEILSSEDERWVMGTGYLDAWEVLHRAEEERLLRLGPKELVAEAFTDWLRLRGSNIPQSHSLADKARMAAGYLIPDAYQYFLEPTGMATVKPPTNVTTAQRATAPQMIRGVRRAINGYREERYDRIVRARNQLVLTTAFTALVGYLGLGLALLAGVPTPAIFAASAYFVVGATVGMVVRLRTDSSRSVAMEDYGLSTARLLHTPLLSGVAGIAGVALIALAGTVGGVLEIASAAFSPDGPAVTREQPVTGQGTEQGASTTEQLPVLVQIFDVGRYPAGLAIAAIFGFSPPLLLRGLQRHIDQYKLDLAASEPGGNGSDDG